MDQVSEINQCIEQCSQLIKELQALTDNSGNNALKSTLNESAHHLKMCVLECEYALKEVP